MASTARSGDPASEIWGTWEELLLACAVNLHGTRSWDSVAMEVQARSSFSDLFTPQSCRQRYLDLRRRFESGGNGIKNDADDDSGGGDSGSPAEIPWLEELRKLRMVELRREVERYDASITSLQSKLKQLRAEREASETGEGEMDLKEEEKNKNGELPESPPGLIIRDRMSCGDSRGSCKESNSTDLKVKDRKIGDGGDEANGTKTAGEADPRGPAAMARPAGDVSCNGSSETLQKSAVQTAEGRPPAGESGESVADESAEVLGEKESSDVQSSASLSRRRRGRRRKAVSGSSSIAGDAETDAISPIAAYTKRIAAESQPLASSLEIIRSCKYGSIFMRRLESQESTKYRNLIRRHVDLEIVRARLERMGTKYTSTEFFRDLLLLCNNAIVFFPKGSPESTDAVHLREIVSKEMSAIFPKHIRPPLQLPPPPAAAAATTKESSPPRKKSLTMLKLDADLKSSLPGKKRSSGSIVACRKRSSITAKVAAAGVSETAGKEETEGMPDSDLKREEGDKPSIVKPKAKERFKVPATRGLRTSKSRGSSGNRNSRNSKPSPKSSFMVDENAEEVPPKSQKKKNVAGFLKRLKEKSSPSPTEGKFLSSLKGPRGGSGGKEAEQKRGTREGRKEAASSSQEKATSADSGPPAKRSVGRPPKRLAPTPSPPPAKRVKGETAPAKRPPAPPSRKRGRK